MKKILLLIYMLIPASLFSQNINGNNNTVIIQMQGNSNNINNSSVNNTDNSRVVHPKHSSYQTPTYFGYYSGYIYHTFKKNEEYKLSLYNDGTFRFSINGNITHGIYTKTTNSRSNNTIELGLPTKDVYTGRTHTVFFATLYITNGEFQYNNVVLREAIPGTELK